MCVAKCVQGCMLLRLTSSQASLYMPAYSNSMTPMQVACVSRFLVLHMYCVPGQEVMPDTPCSAGQANFVQDPAFHPGQRSVYSIQTPLRATRLVS